MITAGVAMKRCENDLLGFAVGAGRDSSGSDDWQGVVESFYRWQIGPSFQMTPEVQIVFGNGLDPSHSYRFVAGLRAELAF
jgi:carbohydrate-selective porin OprB